VVLEDEDARVKVVQRYADDIDLPYSTLRAYKATARAWTVDTRVSTVSW